jgi:GNAT superfamily N-acetyltransferase
VTILAFRPVGDGDVKEVIALWARRGLTRPWNDAAKDIAFARAGASSDVLVARLDGNVAASVMVGHDGHRGAVYYVSVDPALQGRGYGRQTMAAAEAWFGGRVEAQSAAARRQRESARILRGLGLRGRTAPVHGPQADETVGPIAPPALETAIISPPTQSQRPP